MRDLDDAVGLGVEVEVHAVAGLEFEHAGLAVVERAGRAEAAMNTPPANSPMSPMIQPARANPEPVSAPALRLIWRAATSPKISASSDGIDDEAQHQPDDPEDHRRERQPRPSRRHLPAGRPSPAAPEVATSTGPGVAADGGPGTCPGGGGGGADDGYDGGGGGNFHAATVLSSGRRLGITQAMPRP